MPRRATPCTGYVCRPLTTDALATGSGLALVQSRPAGATTAEDQRLVVLPSAVQELMSQQQQILASLPQILASLPQFLASLQQMLASLQQMLASQSLEALGAGSLFDSVGLRLSALDGALETGSGSALVQSRPAGATTAVDQRLVVLPSAAQELMSQQQQILASLQQILASLQQQSLVVLPSAVQELMSQQQILAYQQQILAYQQQILAY